MEALWKLPARELARHVAAKEVACAEVVDAYLARIAEVNPRVNALVRVLDADARAAARAADAKVGAGEPLGPLHGVPFTVKENIDVAGQATTWGLPALAQAVVPMDAPIVERMRAAGAILVGRTNLPDMALRVHTHSSLHGLTKNPWNPGRTCGGSSGGDAVALATGMTAIGLGNDIGGSLRNPANACGIASIRPSRGRVPDAGFVPAEDRPLAVQLMNVQGPMARSVADVRAALKVVMGAHPRDPWSVDAPFDGPAPQRPIRVAVVAEPPGGSTDPAIAATVRRCADALANAGYEVVDACPPRYADAITNWMQFLLGDFEPLFPQLLPIMGEDGRSFLSMVRGAVPPLANAAALSALLVQRDGIGRAWSQFFAQTPLVLSPTWAQHPFAVGHDVASPEAAAEVMESMRPVVPANLLGLPSACVPAGRDAASGVPTGVLLTGARFREDLCLAAAEVVEARLGLKTPIEPTA
jgi:amidase